MTCSPRPGTRALRRARGRSGQASLELVASIPLLVAGALVAFQLMATAYALHLAGGAAEAGALAIAAGTDAEPAARAALPGWAKNRVKVNSGGDGKVQVTVEPPAPIPALSSALRMTASAWAKSPHGG